MKKNSNGLIAAILVAAILISASFVYLAIQYKTLGSGDAVNTADNNSNVITSIDPEVFAKAVDEYSVYMQNKDLEAQKAQEEAIQEMAQNVEPLSDEDHLRGDKDAVITLIEYSDFECPYCKRFHPISKEFFDKNSDKVNWTYRHYPLSFHDPLATYEALATECVADLGGNDAFWEYADLIYENTSSNGNGLTHDELLTFATDLGVDADEFSECVENEKYLKDVQADIASGSAAGVSGTPASLLRNNESGEVIFLSGAQPVEAFEAAVEELLK